MEKVHPVVLHPVQKVRALYGLYGLYSIVPDLCQKKSTKYTDAFHHIGSSSKKKKYISLISLSQSSPGGLGALLNISPISTIWVSYASYKETTLQISLPFISSVSEDKHIFKGPE